MPAMENKGIKGFLDTTITRPNVDSMEFKSQRKMNSLIVSWIFNAIDSSLIPTIVRRADAKDLWDTIRL